MQNFLNFPIEADFLERVSRTLIDTGYRLRARCNDFEKGLSLIGACQKSNEPVKVLLASVPINDRRATDFLRRVRQDFPDVTALVVQQDNASRMALDVFSVRSDAPDGPGVTPDARSLADIIGEAVAGAAEERSRRQAAGRVCEKLLKLANSDDFIERFLDELFAFLNVEKGSIFLFDEKRKRMVLVAARSGDGLRLVGLTKKLGEGVAGYVAGQKKPLLVVSREATPIPMSHSHGKYETESFICAPILNNGRLIGVLNLTEKKLKKPFNEADLDIVMTILGQLAANVEQAFEQRDLRDKIKKMAAAIKKTGARLRNLRKKMERSQKLAEMGEQVVGVAHEINNALDGIMRFTNFALKKADGDEFMLECLSEAKKGLERICRITKTLRPDAKNCSKTFAATNVNELLHNLLASRSYELTQSNIRVVERFHPELPTVAARNHVDQVFINLIKNAVEAMKPGGTLEVCTGFDEESVLIQFKDTGCGIPEQVLSKLCEAGVTTKENGTGFGLSICKEIIEQHGGELIVESEVGVGSTFTVRLPLNQKKKGN